MKDKVIFQAIYGAYCDCFTIQTSCYAVHVLSRQIVGKAHSSKLCIACLDIRSLSFINHTPRPLTCHLNDQFESSSLATAELRFAVMFMQVLVSGDLRQLIIFLFNILDIQRQ